jgi:PAS domain S-box-containing protein
MTDQKGAIPALVDFHPYFQPIVSLRTGTLHGVELLARWQHPVHGWLSPAAFIAEAEEAGWIDVLTWELLRKSFAATAIVSRIPMLAVNISPLQLLHEDLPQRLQELADAGHFPLERLMIEITESALTHDLARARSIVHDLKRRGCKIALDDFGTGYSSLTQLESLPFDEIKVDRTFTVAMTKKRSCRKIVAAVVGLGQSLGLTTVAEGVETMEQVEMLRWLGCDFAQGWLYGAPISVDELCQRGDDPFKTLHGHAAAGLTEGSPGRRRATVRKNLETLPAQRLAQLQAVYDGAPVGLAFLDCHLRYVNINRTLADMNGHPIEAHLGHTAREMIPELFPLVEPFIRRALNGESISGVEVTKPASGPNAGSTILLSYEPARDEAGEVVGVSVALVDITRLKRSELALRDTELHLRHLMELIPQVPWVIDPEGRALDVSQRWMEMTGMTDDQWRGFGWLDALHPDDRQPTLDAIHRSSSTGEPIDVVYRLRRPGCEWEPMRSRGAARVDADGRIIGWYGCVEPLDAART